MSSEILYFAHNFYTKWLYGDCLGVYFQAEWVRPEFKFGRVKELSRGGVRAKGTNILLPFVPVTEKIRILQMLIMDALVHFPRDGG